MPWRSVLQTCNHVESAADKTPVLSMSMSALHADNPERGGWVGGKQEGADSSTHTSGEELPAEELLAIGVAPLADADRSRPPPLLLLLATARPAAARTATPPSPMATLGPPTRQTPSGAPHFAEASQLSLDLLLYVRRHHIRSYGASDLLALGGTGMPSDKVGSVGQEQCSLGASDGTGSDGVGAGLPACGAGAGARGGNPAFGGAFGGSGVLRKDGGAGPPGYGTAGALGCSKGAAGGAVCGGQPQVRHEWLLK